MLLTVKHLSIKCVDLAFYQRSILFEKSNYVYYIAYGYYRESISGPQLWEWNEIFGKTTQHCS